MMNRIRQLLGFGGEVGPPQRSAEEGPPRPPAEEGPQLLSIEEEPPLPPVEGGPPQPIRRRQGSQGNTVTDPETYQQRVALGPELKRPEWQPHLVIGTSFTSVELQRLESGHNIDLAVGSIADVS